MIRPPPKSTPFPHTTLFRSKISLQYPRDRSELELGPSNATQRLAAPLEPKRAKADAIDSPIARENGQKDRKSTRLNSSHLVISYAVFCLIKKKPPHCHYPHL